METVIAEYQDLISAERSVRWLEAQGISIQNVSIVDEAKRFWRKSHPAWGRRSTTSLVGRSVLLGTAACLVLSQLLIAGYALTTGHPLNAESTWLWVSGASLVGGCVSALASVKLAAKRTKRRRKRPAFSVILRSDAATLAAVGHFFPHARGGSAASPAAAPIDAQ